MLKSSQIKNANKSGRTGFWPVPAEPSADGPVHEGTGLLWLQEKMPSWRWYLEHARDAAGQQADVTGQ